MQQHSFWPGGNEWAGKLSRLWREGVNELQLPGLHSAATGWSLGAEAETWGVLGFLALSQSPGAILSELKSQLCHFLGF